jgi:hypothetical protein
VLARYCHAVDDRDWETYRTIFTEDAVIDDLVTGGMGHAHPHDSGVRLVCGRRHLGSPPPGTGCGVAAQAPAGGTAEELDAP